jgi:hypothetical protein
LPGKDDVRVSIRIAVIVIVVRNRQLRRGYGSWNFPETRITKRIVHLKRLLRPQMHAAGRDQRHAAGG